MTHGHLYTLLSVWENKALHNVFTVHYYYLEYCWEQNDYVHLEYAFMNLIGQCEGSKSLRATISGLVDH